MNPMLQHLIKLVQPPTEPVAPGSSEAWKQVEEEMGTPLPQDFKDYTNTYGAGQWADFFGIRNPFYQWKNPHASKSWKEWLEKRFEGFLEFQAKYPKDSPPFGVYPAAEGLLGFGYHDNGGTICWQTTGPCDSWPIVCLDGKLSAGYDIYQMTLTEFLVGLVEEKIAPKTFAPDLFPFRRPAFQPYTTE
jgi:hypothetical protein